MWLARLSRRKGRVIVNAMDTPVAVRGAQDGTAQRVPLVVEARGGAGKMLREQIGCQMLEVVALDDRLDVWGDEEALMGVDLDDRASVLSELNPVATIVASRLGQIGQPVFGVAVFTGRGNPETCGLDAAQLATVEGQVALAAKMATRIVGVR